MILGGMLTDSGHADFDQAGHDFLPVQGGYPVF